MDSSAEDCPTPNITNVSQYFDIPSVSDISGIGVLIGFIAPAYILLAIVCIYYMVTYDPALDPYREEGDQSKCSRPNPFDQHILRLIRKLFGVKDPQLRHVRVSEALQDAFNKCVLSMADVQVFTGLSILISGYVTRKGLSALHWKMIVYLAWFSCATHLSALVFLRNYLINHSAKRRWRLFSMFALLVVLIVAMVPTGHFSWDVLIYMPYNDDLEHYANKINAPPSANAICYFNVNFKSTDTQGKNAMLISMLLLSLSFVVRLFKLHRGFLGFTIQSSSHHMVERVLSSAQYFQKLVGVATWQDRLVSNIIVAAHITVCVWIDLYTSTASDVYWLIISLAWGTTKIAGLLNILSKSPHHDNDTWTFGQVLPVLLLILPMISLVEHFLKSMSQVKGQTASMRSFTWLTYPIRVLAALFGHQNVTRATPLTTTPSSSDAATTWIIKPELPAQCYRDSIGMFWVVTICNSFNIMMAIMLLLPYGTNDAGAMVIIDALDQAESLAIWYIISQGATIHLAILFFSFIEAKWRRQAKTHLAFGLITAGLIVASIFLCQSVRSASHNGYLHRVGAPMSYLATTLGIFIIALFVRQPLNWLQERGRRPVRAEQDAIPLSGNNV